MEIRKEVKVSINKIHEYICLFVWVCVYMYNYIEEAKVEAGMGKVIEGFGTLMRISGEEHQIVNCGDLIIFIMIRS